MEVPLATVSTQVNKVSEKFDQFLHGHSNNLQKLADRAHTLDTELLQDASGEPDLSVTGVMLFEQFSKRVRENVAKLGQEHRDMHAAVSKIGKEVDRALHSNYTDVARASDQYEKVASKRERLNSLINQRLLAHGLLSVAETFEKEAGISVDSDQREKYEHINKIVEALRQKDLEPALQWVNSHGHLSRNGTDFNMLAFSLHRLRYLQMLNGGPDFIKHAAAYAKNFAPFAQSFSRDIEVLMGALAFSHLARGQQSELSIPLRYRSILNCNEDANWGDICDQFSRVACRAFGVAFVNPLGTVLEAGCIALPQLLAIRQAVQLQQVQSALGGAHQVPLSGLTSDTVEMPIEIHLDQPVDPITGAANPVQTRYHSVFACPILRQQTTANNPPMRLACGHAISKDALTKLASGNRLKCPYCPSESLVDEAVQLLF